MSVNQELQTRPERRRWQGPGLCRGGRKWASRSGWRAVMAVVNLSPKGLVPAQAAASALSALSEKARLGFSVWMDCCQARLLPVWGQQPAPPASSPPPRLNVSIECKRVSGLEPATVDWAFDLTKTNMQTM